MAAGLGLPVLTISWQVFTDGALYAVLIAKKNHVTLLALVWLPGVMADEIGVCQGKGVKPREARRVVLPARTGQGIRGLVGSSAGLAVLLCC